MKEILLTLVIGLIALFAWQVDKIKWKRAYLESKVEYCQQLVVAYWTNNPAEIKHAEKLYFYGCTRSDD